MGIRHSLPLTALRQSPNDSNTSHWPVTLHTDVPEDIMKKLVSITAVTTILTAGAFSLPVLADDNFRAEEIQQLVSAGIVQPLDTLLQAKPLTGKLLKSELERDDGRWVYEVKWKDEQGRRHETDIDAKTGE